MKVSIVTPSYQNSEWLKRCVLSVADQGEALCEHIVQDAESTDGTREWLAGDPRVRAFFEKDEGMYDAINRGFDRASGDILGYLNCDEQYLPSALAQVVDFFQRHPHLDAVVGDTVILDGAAGYLCSRLGQVPGPWGTWVRFPVVTSSFFLRRTLWEKGGVRFDTRWRVFGDLFFVLELLARKVRFGVIPSYLSAFFDHGENLYLRANTEEVVRRQQSTPWHARLFYFPLFCLYWVKTLWRARAGRGGFSYDLYLPGESKRTQFRVQNTRFFWRGRSRWKAKGGNAPHL